MLSAKGEPAKKEAVQDPVKKLFLEKIKVWSGRCLAKSSRIMKPSPACDKLVSILAV